MPCHGCPTTRLVAMPPSPPKKPGNISAEAATISAMPSEIMANGVPERARGDVAEHDAEGEPGHTADEGQQGHGQMQACPRRSR